MVTRRLRSEITRLVFCAIALAIAGCGTGGGVAEAPVYINTPTGQRVEALQMSTARADAAAIALRDGRVLICGGTSNGQIGGVVSSAEIFDPATQTLMPTGNMNSPRMGHTITMLNDGRVLVTGGQRNVGYRTSLASAEIYDPSAGTFTPTASMSKPREGHTATLLRDGRVLIAGGSPNGITTSDSAEIYDPVSSTFQPASHMTVPREAHVAVALLSGQVLIAGGGRGGMPGGYISYDTAEMFDPNSSSFRPVNSHMTSDRVGPAAVLLQDGRALIVGGKSGKVLMGGMFGGTRNIASFAPLNTTDIYDPEAHKFLKGPNAKAPHYLGTATMLTDGSVIVIGGYRQQGPTVVGMYDADLYDRNLGIFVHVAPTHVARLEETSTLLPNGKVLVAGGIDANSKITSSIEFYAPNRRAFQLEPEGPTE